jgi:hypothetical protein
MYVSKVLLVPVEPVLKPKKRTTLKIGDREFCVYEDSIQFGPGYIAFTDCSNMHRVIPVATQFSTLETGQNVYKPS